MPLHEKLKVNQSSLITHTFLEPENRDLFERSRQLVNEVIIDICGNSRSGIYLDELETQIECLFGDSFEDTVGLKLLEYLAQNKDNFTTYKIPESKNEEAILVTKTFQNPEGADKQTWFEDEVGGDLVDNEKDDKFRRRGQIDYQNIQINPLPNKSLVSSNLTKQDIHNNSLIKNEEQSVEALKVFNEIEEDKIKDSTTIQQHAHQENEIVSQKGENQKNSQTMLPSTNLFTESICEFMKKIHNFERNSESFALVVGKTDILPNIESLSVIPWLCVFDFDMFSRNNGLMSVLEGHINTIHPCTLKDRPRFSFSYTYWCQMRGNSQTPDSCMECNARSWLNRIKLDLDAHLKTLEQYISNNTKLKVILLWPERADDIKFILHFLPMLDAVLLPDIFVVYSNMLREPESMSHLDFTFKLQVPFEFFYSYLSENCHKTKPLKTSTYRLPTFDKCNDACIDDYTAKHLQEDLNILYLQCSLESNYDVYDIKDEGANFLRGGTLPWFVYYECDEGGYFDVKRDQMNTIVRDIKDWLISSSQSAILEVYHSPGAGGTTLSQRILWELHEDIPCVQIKSNIQSTMGDIVQHIKLLFEKTQLPILVLLDGRDDSEVKYLYNQIRMQSVSVIILHVRRSRKELTETKLRRGKYWVKSQVSEREAKQFCIRYQDFCDTEEKKKNLQSITHDVAKDVLHQVYEFGLTTFAHEFKGVETLVKGYLELNPDSELNSTQKMLGYLSLVYFFGQASVPCELFSNLLKRDDGITFDDLPFEVRQLVVKSNHHQHQGYIRICHQVVAKEILEQLLTRNVLGHQKPLSQNLSQEACRNLVDFGIEFINELKMKYNEKVHWRKNIVVNILTKTFLQRNTQDICEYSSQKQKPRFSRFFTDIEMGSSRHDRIKIMENLVSCCPQNPNYYAHLGRMYSMYYQGEQNDVAENFFKKAISLCEEKVNVIKGVDLSFEEQFSYSSIYHMYGMHLHQKVCRITKDSKEAEFDRDVEIVLDYVQNACSNFEKSRERSFPGIGQSYGLIGEIMTRTVVCDYINKHLEMCLPEYVKSTMSPVVAFVRESMVHICELITQCYSTVDRDELPTGISHYVNRYKELFKGQNITQLCSIEGPVDCTQRRHFVTQIKFRYSKTDILSLNNETPSVDIEEIVHNLEENFKHLEKKENKKCSTGLIESDFKDWIDAIRLNQYEKENRLETVLQKLNRWHEHVHTPISKFYVFISCASLSILNNDRNYFIQAKDMLEEVKTYKSHFVKPYKPREWFGVSAGVKCLIPGLFLKPKSDSGIDEVDIIYDSNIKPRFFKGTISGNNKRPLMGTISLNVCKGSQFDVVFVPTRTKEKLMGSMYQNTRVEFILGFTVTHGFMAYNVKRLTTLQCERCKRNVEFVTNQCTAECTCGISVKNPKAKEKYHLAFS